MSYYKNPTCLSTEVPSSAGLSIHRNVDLTHQPSYYVAFTDMTKILDVNILKYVKLITINSQRCTINSIKSIKNKPFQVLQSFATVWIMRTDIASIVRRDLVLVQLMQCVVSSGEMYLIAQEWIVISA
jgi:hypothetical protein